MAVAAVLWWMLLQIVSGQDPIVTYRYTLYQIGICRGVNFLEEMPHLLGSLSKAGSEGVVAEYLRTEASALSMDNEFYTDSLPQVQIISVKQTCASKYAYDFGNITLAGLIMYTCRGVACRQRANEIRLLEYVHLFSFTCLPGADDRTLGLFNQLTLTRHLAIYVDRHPPNSLVNTIIAPFGSCESCSVLPHNLREANYDPATGCNSKISLCIAKACRLIEMQDT